MSQFATITQEASDAIDKTIRRAMIEVDRRLVYSSPVGNPDLWSMPALVGYVGGRFRANWQYNYSSPISTETPNIDASGGKTLAEMTSGVIRSPVVGLHYVTNNLAYAQKLEDGHSKQAPSGMVKLVEIAWPGIVAMAERQS